MDSHRDARIPLAARGLLLRLWQHRKESGLTDPNEFYPVDLNEIVTLMGWHLNVVSDLGFSNLAPVHGECDHRKTEIRIASHTAFNKGQLNFTIAHEIGHAVLHPQQDCVGLVEERVLSKRPSSQLRVPRIAGQARSPREDEADVFASELLMPGKAVKEKFREAFGCDSLPVWSQRLERIVGGEVKGPSRVRAAARLLAENEGSLGKPLHELFGVSKVAMARRLEQLQLVY